MEYTKEESFNYFCNKYLEVSYDDEYNSSRNQIYTLYRLWHASDENINRENLIEWNNASRNIITVKDIKAVDKLFKKVNKCKLIRKTEFYRMLHDKYPLVSMKLNNYPIEFKIVRH